MLTAMQILTKNPTLCPTNRGLVSPSFNRAKVKCLLLLLLSAIVMLTACGGTSSGGGSSLPPANLSGNWQFNMAEQLNPNASQPSFTGGLLGGFLLQSNGSVTGGANFSITSVPPTGTAGIPTPCNSGTTQIKGTIGGQVVTLTATPAGSAQTYSLTGTLSLDGSTMSGTYTSTEGAGCGIATTQLWRAQLVPPLTGSIQGSFQSTGGASGLSEQDFLVSGDLNQGANVGAASAPVTGNFNFLNPTTNLSNYPCFSSASVEGQISGDTVTLQIVGANGMPIGLIGETVETVGSTVSATGLNPVTFASTSGGYVLSGAGPSYLVAMPGAAPCAGQLNDKSVAGDFGNICLALNSTTACPEPFKLSPSGLVFPTVPAGSPAIFQTVTLTNTSGAILSGLKLAFANADANVFTETDSCGPSGTAAGKNSFSLGYGESCAITVTFTPLACGTQCGSPLAATLTVSLGTEFILNLVVTGEEAAAAASAELAAYYGHASNASARPIQDVRDHAEIE